MKSINSRNSPRNHTPGTIRYCNYYLEFPDGDVWCDFIHIAGGFNSWIQRTALWRSNPEAARKLKIKGEYHWKDNNGVGHRMVISEQPCTRKWGLNKNVKRRSALELVR